MPIRLCHTASKSHTLLSPGPIRYRQLRKPPVRAPKSTPPFEHQRPPRSRIPRFGVSSQREPRTWELPVGNVIGKPASAQAARGAWTVKSRGTYPHTGLLRNPRLQHHHSELGYILLTPSLSTPSSLLAPLSRPSFSSPSLFGLHYVPQSLIVIPLAQLDFGGT